MMIRRTWLIAVVLLVRSRSGAAGRRGHHRQMDVVVRHADRQAGVHLRLRRQGSTLTGKMKSNIGESDVLDGKVDGDKVTFGELLKFEGMEIRITYTGTIVSADEIKFTRNVADFATEELVAKRVK